MSRRTGYLVLAAVAGLPRLVALVADRHDLFQDFTDKSNEFAQVFVTSGTFGFIPGHPSAYTQPLYAFFLTPLYWAFGQSWLLVGLAQIAVAVATAWLVLEIGRRVVSPAVGLIAALVTTLHPYLIWHDIHLNREILDQALAAAFVLVTLLVAERMSWPRIAAFGTLAGLSVLSNVRLALLPVVLLGYVAWQRSFDRRFAVASAAVVAIGLAVVAPWVIRNGLVVGCWNVTTDSRALWKANNENTYEVVSRGRWIDDVPSLPGTEISPQTAGKIYRETGRIVEVDECGQMRFYQDEVFEFWREHPGQKARLALLATQMQWQPSITLVPGRPGTGTWLDTLRRWTEPLWAVPLYLLALIGAWRTPRHYLVLAAGVLLYQTLIAIVFIGSTRYRVPWDFLLAVPAAVAIVWLYEWLRTRRPRPPSAGRA